MVHQLKKLKNFPEAITQIPDNAFYSCKSLERIELTDANQLEVIGDSAFENCEVLTTLFLPNSLKSIGSKAFSHCDAIDNLIIPANVTNIGNNAFANTDELTHLTNNSKVSNDQGSRVGLTLRTITINIGDEGKYVDGVSAPTNYYSWDTVYLPKCQLQDFGNFSTYDILGFTGELTVNDTTVSFKPTGLKSVVATAQYQYNDYVKRQNVTYELSADRSHYIISDIEEGVTDITLQSKIGELQVTEIDRSAFEGNTTVKTISNFPSSITKIPEYAFYGCSSLTQIEFASDSELTEIGTFAFAGCTSLNSITIPSKVTSIGKNAFLNTLNLLTYTNNSNTLYNGDFLGLEARKITYTRNNSIITDTSSLVNYYYVSDKTVTLTFPSVEYRRIAHTTLTVNGSSVDMPENGNSITVSTQGKSEINVAYEDEGYYTPNVSGLKDDNFGLRIYGSTGTEEYHKDNYVEFCIGVDRDYNNSKLLLDDYKLVFTATGSSGKNYAINVTVDSDGLTGKITFDAGSKDTISIRGTVSTKITGKTFDSFTKTFTVE